MPIIDGDFDSFRQTFPSSYFNRGLVIISLVPSRHLSIRAGPRPLQLGAKPLNWERMARYDGVQCGFSFRVYCLQISELIRRRPATLLNFGGKKG